MSRRAPHRGPAVSGVGLEGRIQKALREGRSQQALELARQLFKHEPVEAHRELLKKACLERARHLRAQGCTHDAATVLENALALGGGAARWAARLAEELAACGETARALALIEGVSDPALRSAVLARAVDGAVRKGPAGRAELPADLQPAFDGVVRAFELAEAGRDEAAREALQAIGLQSPFLEWKVFLRGLLAYYQNDDVWAVENWQRLKPDRLPARWAAPLRAQIDPSYQAAQPPEGQAELRRQADRLQGVGVLASLRAVQEALGNGERLPQAFRLAQDFVPSLRRAAPAAVPRLAACFYAAVIEHGNPEDHARYRKVFGAPPDDPALDRLQALTCEHLHEPDRAHRHWQQFEESVAANPAWPDAQKARVRALVWLHMGRNAAGVPSREKLARLPPHLRDFPGLPEPLQPSAEACFRRSIELAPDLREGYEVLFDHYREEDKPAEAEAVGRRLLERFPDHSPTLEALADLRLAREGHAEALALYQRALRVNPLDRGLQRKVATARRYHARGLAQGGRYEEARAEYQAALAAGEPQRRPLVLSQWAACEFKAGDGARAEELLAEALAHAPGRLPVAYTMVVEGIRLRLSQTVRSRFDLEFNQALAEPPTCAVAAAVASAAASLRAPGLGYRGQKAHEKKIQKYLERAKGADFTAEALTIVCQSLLALQMLPLARSFAALGQKKFRKDPTFPLVEAASYMDRGPEDWPVWKVRPLLAKAEKLAREAPPDEKRTDLLEQICQRRRMIDLADPFGPAGFVSRAFEDMFAEEDEDGWDDDDGGDWDEGGSVADPDDRPRRGRPKH